MCMRTLCGVGRVLSMDGAPWFKAGILVWMVEWGSVEHGKDLCLQTWGRGEGPCLGGEAYSYALC